MERRAAGSHSNEPVAAAHEALWIGIIGSDDDATQKPLLIDTKRGDARLPLPRHVAVIIERVGTGRHRKCENTKVVEPTQRVGVAVAADPRTTAYRGCEQVAFE